jgi:hypothetical protein
MSFIGQQPVSFPLLPGIQQFENALVLFINVGGQDYDNVFTEIDSSSMFACV